ncbi:MAG: acyl-CoA dehydrogenase family protein [Candidatus Rokubacteria bacterium]|nr:acyl-CoA dehydrogenase family protein [Candidatus Rokubacteria bacterium]
MEFAFTAAEQAFATEVRRFLRDHLPDRFPHDGMDAGYGSGAHSRAFLRALAAEGWLSMTWPREFGGQERSLMHKLILFEELALAGAPFGPLAGCAETADAIIRYGSERLKREVLPRIARGEATFWQGFSEPNAGSDLLSLRTEGTRDGDDWVINGHKIWSSHAGISTYGLVLARTSPGARRSQGLSMFVVDNTLPGMDIRPIRSLTGEVYHYEVFLDRVRVPGDYLLGRENEGFVQLLKGLDTDRFWGRFYKAPALKRLLGELVEYANTTRQHEVPLARNAVIRRQLAGLATEIEALRLLFYRIGWMLERGLPTPYESALVKVLADETGQRLAAAGMDILGLWGPLREGSRWAKLEGRIQHLYQTGLGQTIAGGTSEILRTTVATRGLGLPREPGAGR